MPRPRRRPGSRQGPARAAAAPRPCGCRGRCEKPRKCKCGQGRTRMPAPSPAGAASRGPAPRARLPARGDRGQERDHDARGTAAHPRAVGQKIQRQLHVQPDGPARPCPQGARVRPREARRSPPRRPGGGKAFPAGLIASGRRAMSSARPTRSVPCTARRRAACSWQGARRPPCRTRARPAEPPCSATLRTAPSVHECRHADAHSQIDSLERPVEDRDKIAIIADRSPIRRSRKGKRLLRRFRRMRPGRNARFACLPVGCPYPLPAPCGRSACR